jgi:UDPglucose 6-dehydrogenase
MIWFFLSEIIFKKIEHTSKKMDDYLMKLGMIGLGKIGLPLAILMSKYFSFSGVDIDEDRINQINQRKKFFEPHLNEYLEKYGDNLIVSTDYTILEDCEVVFILTQSPSLDSGKFDSNYVKSALESLNKVNPECLAVISSTINIGDMIELRKIHPRLAYNPEFIRQGTIIRDFEFPKFVLIGAYEQEDYEKIAKIWSTITERPIYLVKPVEAEVIKLSSNLSFTLGITFANIIGELCDKFDADSNRVLEIIYKDRRDYKAGLGYSGPCFPRDVKCFGAICKEDDILSGYHFAQSLSTLNELTIQRAIKEILLHGSKSIGILGVSYKPNVPYIWGSQPISIAQNLLEQGYEINIYDPIAEENAKKVLRGNIHFYHELEECIKKSEVIFIGTPDYSNIKTSKKIVNFWR